MTTQASHDRRGKHDNRASHDNRGSRDNEAYHDNRGCDNTMTIEAGRDNSRPITKPAHNIIQGCEQMGLQSVAVRCSR